MSHQRVDACSWQHNTPHEKRTPGTLTTEVNWKQTMLREADGDSEVGIKAPKQQSATSNQTICCL